MSSSKLIPAIFLPSSGGSFHTILFPVSPLLSLGSQPGSLERAHREVHGAAVLAADGDAGHRPRVPRGCCGCGSNASGPQSCALTPLLCPHAGGVPALPHPGVRGAGRDLTLCPGLPETRAQVGRAAA